MKEDARGIWRSPAVLVIVASVVAWNIWFDYRHPLGILFDAIIVLFWAFGRRRV